MSSAMITLSVTDLFGLPVKERIVCAPTIHDCLDIIDGSALPPMAVRFLNYIDRQAASIFPRMGVTYEEAIPGGTLLITVDAA